jgi:hypothetical protein
MIVFRTRSTFLVLLLVLTLATVVHARPDGSDHFDTMDFTYFASMGGQFSDVLVQSQLAQMVGKTWKSDNPIKLTD